MSWLIIGGTLQMKTLKKTFISIFRASILMSDSSLWRSGPLIKRCGHFQPLLLRPSWVHWSEVWQCFDRREMLVWHTGWWMLCSTVTRFLTNHFNPCRLPDPTQINMTQHKWHVPVQFLPSSIVLTRVPFPRTATWTLDGSYSTTRAPLAPPLPIASV